jgi:hypothetical protein
MSHSSSNKNSLKKAMTHWIFSPLAGVTYTDWTDILQEYGQHIPPRYWPRVMFTTAMSLMNSALSTHEQKKYTSQLQSVKVAAPIFIVGHHRSGTSHLWRLLTQDDRFIFPRVTDTIFPHTLLTFSKIANKLAEWFSPNTRPQDDVKQPASSPLEEEWGLCTCTFLSTIMTRYFPESRDQFKYMLSLNEAAEDEKTAWKSALYRFAQKLHLSKEKEDAIILFKAPANTAKIDLILDVFPQARFIHIYRDPYRVYQSTMKMERKSLPFCSFQSMNLDGLEQFVLWRHREMYDAFLADRPRIPKNHFTQLSYEDLVKDRAGAVRNIYKELGLGGYDKMKPGLMGYINSISDYQTNSYPSLSQQKKRKIITSWYPFFNEFGYSTQLKDPLIENEPIA